MSENMEFVDIPGTGNFGFSAISPDDLPEEEYTVVTIYEDLSPSTEGVRKQLLEARRMVVEACMKSPRAEKLLIRFGGFGTSLEEIHGYKSLSEIDLNEYKKGQTIGGGTALYDAMYDGVSSVIEYAKIMDTSADILSNGIVFILTDGMDNSSTMGPVSVVDKMNESKITEALESLKLVLVSFHDPAYGAGYNTASLEDVCKSCNIDQYIDAGSATPQKIAKMAEFVSQSISSQSQSLGTGGPSQNLAF